MEKILLSWSGGKDSALALHELIKSQEYYVAALVTTVTEDYDRISMHGVRRVLLEQQADALALPFEKVLITKNASNGEFHSFVFAAPIFRERIAFSKGSVVLRDDRFYFCDLIPEHE
jgi:diphthamide synthase (EF-2-diphthine--ammonia ligase)